MANRGIYGSASSIKVPMGDCGTAFVDVSPVTPNLCFEIPLITTGGAKPLSLSLLYNERSGAPSIADFFPGGFRLNLYRVIAGVSSLTAECPDGPVREFAEAADGLFRSFEDPVAIERVSVLSSVEYRCHLSATDYLVYPSLGGIGLPFPSACVSHSENVPAFTVAQRNDLGIASISLTESGRSLVFGYSSGDDPHVVRIQETKTVDNVASVVQTVVLGYTSGAHPRLQTIRAFHGSDETKAPFRDISFSKAADFVWSDNLRSLSWTFEWDEDYCRVLAFRQARADFNQSSPYIQTAVQYSGGDQIVLTSPPSFRRAIHFDGDLPYLVCDENGIAEEIRYDPDIRRLLRRSGPVCLNPAASVNSSQILLNPFFANGMASWACQSGSSVAQPSGVYPFAAFQGSGAVRTPSMSQTVSRKGLPGDWLTAFALIKGTGDSGAGKARLTLRLIESGGSEVASESAESLFEGAEGRTELISVTATAGRLFSSAQVKVECPGSEAIVEAVLLLGRGVPLLSRYDELGRFTSSAGSSGPSGVIYYDEVRPYLSGGPGSFMRYLGRTSPSPYVIDRHRSLWGVESDEWLDGSFLPVASSVYCPSDPSLGSVEESRSYDQCLVLSSAYGEDGTEAAYQCSLGSDLLSSSETAGGDLTLAVYFDYADSGAPWSLSDSQISDLSGLDYYLSYSYDSSRILLGSCSEDFSWPIGQNAIVSSWSYDSSGSVTSVSQSGSSLAQMVYADENGRHLLKSLSFGNGSFSWSHDSFGRAASLSYAEPNQAPSQLGAWSYDELGRVVQAGGDSFCYRDDGSVSELSSGSLSVQYSSFGPHTRSVVSFGAANSAIICSHGADACSYGDPGLSEALFQLIPGISSCVFDDPTGEGGVSRLTLRGFRTIAPEWNVGMGQPAFDDSGAVPFFWIGDGSIRRHPTYRFSVLPGAEFLSHPGFSLGGWFSLYSGQEGKTLLHLSVAVYPNAMDALYSAFVRIGQDSLECVLQASESPGAVILSAPFSCDGWHFLSVRLLYGLNGLLSSVTLRVDADVFVYTIPPSGPSLAYPPNGATNEVAFMGQTVVTPSGAGANYSVVGRLYAPFAATSGLCLSDADELFAFRETRKRLLGDGTLIPSPLAAATYTRPAPASGFRALAPLEGDYSLIAGSVAPSAASAAVGPFRREGDSFRYDPAEWRFRLFSCGDSLHWTPSIHGDSMGLAFCFRPADIGVVTAERCLCVIGFDYSSLRVILGPDGSLFVRSGSTDYPLGQCSGSSSRWLGVEYWKETRKIGKYTIRAAGICVYFGDPSSSFSSQKITLGEELPDYASLDLGGDPSMPFYGFIDRLGIWDGAWSSSMVSSLQSAFSNQRKVVEESDPFGHLSARTVFPSSGPAVRTDFAPLAVPDGERLLRRPGKVASETLSVGGSPIEMIRYGYDGMGRLASRTLLDPGDPQSPIASEGYSYDGFGRLIRWTDPNNSATTYTWSGAHVASAGGAALYYSGHRLTSFGNQEISYRTDAPFLIDHVSVAPGPGQAGGGSYLSYKGRSIVGIFSLGGEAPLPNCSFSYDALGRRSSKSCAGKTHSYFWEGGRLIRETVSQALSPTHDLRFFYAPSGALAFMTLDGTPYYYVVDAFGSVRGLVDSSGSLVVSYRYDPWGKPTSATDTSGVGLASLNPFRYRSYYYDSETGWYYCMSRYYSPAWMRWVTPDSPEYLDPHSVGGMDPYLYCSGDPVNYMDPTGTFPVLLAMVLIGAAIGAVSYISSELISYAITEEWSWSWGQFAGSVIGGAIGGAVSGLGGSALVSGFVTGFATTAVGMVFQNTLGETNYSAWEIFKSSLGHGLIDGLLSWGVSNIGFTNFTKGRNSFAAISKTISKKAFKGIIFNASWKTIGKMTAYSAYLSGLSSLSDALIDAADSNDWFPRLNYSWF